MNFRMSEKSLFAILLRSSWWASFAIAAGIALVARMALPEQYVAGGMLAAIPFLGIGIVVAWRQLRSPNAARVAAALDVVGSMSWREFSSALEEAFRRDGYVTRRLDGGAADFEMTRAGRSSLVSCKRWKAASTGVESLRDLDAATKAREADEGIYVAVGGVTENARRYAADKRLRVLEGVELAKLIGVVRRARWQPAK
jgi:restriction system protein